MISDAAVRKVAARIKARDKVDDDEALRLARAWAASKDAPPTPSAPACIVPPEAQAKGIRSPRCPCHICAGGIDAMRIKADKNYRASHGGW